VNPKKKHFLYFIALLILFFSCKNQNTEEALLYNNQIISIQDKLTADIDTFMQSINYPNANTAILYQSAVKTTQAVSDSLKSIKQFEGGTALYLETQNYINICDNALKNEGAKIVHLKAKLSQKYTERKIQIINSYSDSLYKKVYNASQKFEKVQNEFAQKYQFEIDENNRK
jgi:predicted nucleic acid-binding protein